MKAIEFVAGTHCNTKETKNMDIKLFGWTIELVAQIKVGRFGYPGIQFWGYDRIDYDMVAYRSIGFWVFSICWYKHWEDEK